MMKKSFLTNAASMILVGSILCIAPTAQAQMKIDPARGVLTMAPLLEKTTPAVVNISVSSTVKAPENRFRNDEFFERFFGDRGRSPNRKSEDEPEERTRRSVGSGVIINAGKGYILTNHHVIDNADKITITLKDGRTAEAELVGSDPGTDVALLKIDLPNLTDVKMMDSDTVKVGDYVIAIGNSFGIGQSVTSGIVSALGRSTFSRDKYQDYIQTDAAINQGNSGGALLNSKGELVGMNTAILSRSGGSNGIGFAVPTNMITNVMDQLIAYGEVRRGRIGVSIQNITPELMAAMNLKSRDGALVGQVTEDSPAEKAGLKAGDVIVKFNGKSILDSDDIRNAVGFVERGQRASITYLRNGKRHTTKINVEKAPDEETDATNNDEDDTFNPASFDAFDGASFGNIPEDIEPRGGDAGVLITKVKRGSEAWDAGLRKDDIVRAINNKDVEDLDAFKDSVSKKKGPLFLTVQRGRAQVFIAVK
ncbi:MAG: serine endoprotease DegQ [Robiginitomaculum sp.]|nr:MAG: serine endoprotease DegQ [Robiginitomaculum sp.]